MGLIPMFTLGQIMKHAGDFADAREELVIETLSYVGENFVNDARNTRTYKDRTKNLRGSIGFGIVANGETVKTDTQGKTEGQAAAKETINEVADELKDHQYGLVCVAGMRYANAVETKGYDVISGSIPATEILLNTLKKELGAK